MDGTLRLLKWLVIALTATMLVGMVALVALFFTRLREPPLPLADEIVLPEGVQATAVTRGRDFVAIVTEAGEILIYDASGAHLRQRVTIGAE